MLYTCNDIVHILFAFGINSADIIGESPPVEDTAMCKQGGRSTKKVGSRLQTMIGSRRQLSTMTPGAVCPMHAVSMRHAFVPFKGEWKLFQSNIIVPIINVFSNFLSSILTLKLHIY